MGVELVFGLWCIVVVLLVIVVVLSLRRRIESLERRAWCQHSDHSDHTVPWPGPPLPPYKMPKVGGP